MKKVRVGAKARPIVAIDPGASGGIAFTDGKIAEARPLGSFREQRDYIGSLVQRHPGILAYMELVGGYIGKEQPGAYMFNFGEGYGIAQGLFLAFDVRLELVRPQKWMRAILPGVIGMEYSNRKRALQQYAQERYPGIQVTQKISDALALLDYATRAEAGEFSGEAPVARPTNWARDSKEARAWCKAEGHPMPPKGGKEFMEMVNYYVREIRG